jgi:hypothetical protein
LLAVDHFDLGINFESDIFMDYLIRCKIRIAQASTVGKYLLRFLLLVYIKLDAQLKSKVIITIC